MKNIKIKKIIVILSCFILILSSVNVVYAGSFRLNKSKIQLYVGEKTTITAVSGTSNVKWSSSNPKIASVPARGKKVTVTAKKAGRTVITANYKGKKVRCAVTVSKTVISKNAIKGSWEIDTDMTMNVNKTTMRDIYGSGFKYGNGMEFSSNGGFLYYAGIGNGGKGNFRIRGKDIYYRIKQYEYGDLETGSIKVIKGKKLRLMTKYYEYKIYWKKK